MNIVRKLTDGVVAKNVCWSTVKAPRDMADIFHKTRCKSKHADTVTSTRGLYSLQESCDLLQSSYDNLYDNDGDEEVGSVETANSDSHGDTLLCSSNSDTAMSDDKDSDAMSDSDAENSVDDSSDRFTMQNTVDLYSPDVWESYYTRLREIGREMKDREGWPNFDAVFMISAIDGDGIVDIKVNSLCFLTHWRCKILYAEV